MRRGGGGVLACGWSRGIAPLNVGPPALLASVAPSAYGAMEIDSAAKREIFGVRARHGRRSHQRIEMHRQGENVDVLSAAAVPIFDWYDLV